MPKKTKPPTMFELLVQLQRPYESLAWWVDAKDSVERASRRVNLQRPDVPEALYQWVMYYQFEYLCEYDQLAAMMSEHRTVVNKLIHEIKNIDKTLRP